MKSKDTQFAAHVQKPANYFTCVSGAVGAAFATYTQLFRVDPRHQRVCANGIYGLRTGRNGHLTAKRDAQLLAGNPGPKNALIFAEVVSETVRTLRQ
jgi:hypothetical protein